MDHLNAQSLLQLCHRVFIQIIHPDDGAQLADIFHANFGIAIQVSSQRIALATLISVSQPCPLPAQIAIA